MRRWLGWAAIAWMIAICAVALAAYGSARAGTSLASRAHDLDSQLRCPACQGESVADSQTQIAQAIRRLVYRDLKEGQTPAQIESYLVSRFGERILMAPPQSGFNWLAWLAPPLLILGGIALLLTLLIDWRRRARAGPSAAQREYVARVREEVIR